MEPMAHSADRKRRSLGWGGLAEALLSLQCKATVLVVIVALGVSAAACGYLLRGSVKLLRVRQDEELLGPASLLARVAGPAMQGTDRTTLQMLASNAVEGAPLEYVVFTDTAGLVLAAAGGSAAIPAITPDPDMPQIPGRPLTRPATGAAPALLDVIIPIKADAEPSAGLAAPFRLVGYLRTGMVADTWQRPIASHLDLLVGVGTLCVLFAVPLGFLAVRRIVSPLEGLANLMDRLSQGQLNVRATARRRDEIGRLSLAFNRMAELHQQTHERIVRLNAELERRVAQRTRQLSELAAREPLTGLYNRRRFNELLDRAVSEALRYDNRLSCIMVDLDDFKRVNDHFGHATGDRVLVLAADTIRRELRSADVPARLGGDEFVVLLPQTAPDRARVLAERIGHRFAAEVRGTLPQVRTGMSMGIASLQADAVADAESLIRAADRALYQAKAAGKDTVRAAAAAEPVAV